MAGLAPSATHLDTGGQHQLYIPNIGEVWFCNMRVNWLDKLSAHCDCELLDG